MFTAGSSRQGRSALPSSGRSLGITRWLRLGPAILAAGCAGSGGATGPGSSSGAPVLRLTVETTGIRPDPDGYSISVGGGSPRAVPANGTVTIEGLAPGSHSVTVDGLAPNCVPTGGGTVFVQASGTTTATLRIECGQLVFVGVIAHGSRGVDVLETVTHSVVGHVPFGGRADDLVLTPDGRFLYATEVISHPHVDSVVVIDTSTLDVVERLPVSEGIWGMAISPDGREIYVGLDDDAGGIVVIETASNTSVATIPTPPRVWDIDVTRGGGHLAVATLLGTQWIDLVSRQAVGSVFPEGPVAAGPDGRTFYVASFDLIYVVDTAPVAIRRSVSVPTNINGDLVFSPDGSRLFVAASTAVHVLAAGSLEVLARHDIRAPARVRFSSDGESAYLSARADPWIHRISLSSGAIIRYDVGGWNRGLAVTAW